MNNYSVLDIDNWKRKSTYDFFRSFDSPFFNVTANVDVTLLKKYCTKNETSFFLTSLFLSQKTINSLENFRLRLAPNQVREYETTQAGSTIFLEDETFTFCYFPVDLELEEFVTKGRLAIEKVMASPDFEPREGDLNMVYYSTLPWVSFTSFQHAHNKVEYDSIPRIVFGKYFEQEGKLFMPVSVEVHHALVDGFHVGQYFEMLQCEINQLIR